MRPRLGGRLPADRASSRGPRGRPADAGRVAGTPPSPAHRSAAGRGRPAVAGSGKPVAPPRRAGTSSAIERWNPQEVLAIRSAPWGWASSPAGKGDLRLKARHRTSRGRMETGRGDPRERGPARLETQRAIMGAGVLSGSLLSATKRTIGAPKTDGRSRLALHHNCAEGQNRILNPHNPDLRVYGIYTYFNPNQNAPRRPSPLCAKRACACVRRRATVLHHQSPPPHLSYHRRPPASRLRTRRHRKIKRPIHLSL
jgi:hypothetical protein